MEFLAISDVAKKLGVSRRTVDRYLAGGKIQPHHRTPGGRARFTKEQVQSWLEGGQKTLNSSGETALPTPSATTPPAAGQAGDLFTRGTVTKPQPDSPLPCLLSGAPLDATDLLG